MKFVCRSHSFRNQEFSSCAEIVETVLFGLKHTLFMPLFAEFSTTSQSTNTKHSTQIVEQNKPRGAESWCDIDVEPSISVEHSDNWFLWFFFDVWKSALLSDTEHRNLSSIFAREPNLVSLEIISIHGPQFS